MTSNGSMFNEMIEWFLGRAADRRQYQRRAGAFPLWYQPDPNDSKSVKPGIGSEISPNGLMFIIPDAITSPEYSLIVRIRDQNIPVRMKAIRHDQVQHQGKTWNRYMGEFLGIAADHWDTIVRYVNDAPEPIDRRKMQNQEMGEKVDDAYRLLPLALQQKIVAMLVSQHKLDEPKSGQTPLLKLFYGGLVKRTGHKPAHRFNVHSRIRINDEAVAYDTRFLITDDGEITLV
ncbi:MAG: PilZ domain-containing protein [Vulcanimicrobiaceae bacterium]